VPSANLPVQFAIAGGKIIGVGNGDANSHEPDKGSSRSLYNGFAQVIVQSERGPQGSMVLRASSPGVNSAVATLRVRDVRPIASVG
jgi:beta-galactosidase